MEFQSLPGLIPYAEGQTLQQRLVERRAADEIPDTVLFLEHAPVITRGRGLQWTGKERPRHMPPPVGLPAEIAYCESERGGDLTYHGPGQLVIYPICKLDGRGFGPDHDIHGFLRGLEVVLIDTLAELGLAGTRSENATGVWVGDRKIASLGIAVRKWVTYHGAALNIVNDLKPFHSISPCGYKPEVMTRVTDLQPDFMRICGGEWRTWWEKKLEARFRMSCRIAS